MRYLGGKGKIAAKIAAQFPPRPFYEPFCGGLNITAAVSGPRWANDANKGLIRLYTALQQGLELPDNVTADEYANYRAKRDETDPLTAFIGFGCSFGGRWFEGYARDKTGRNYALEAKRLLAKKMAACKDVVFTSLDYREFMWSVPNGVLVYCDPPYRGTKGYKTGAFDSGEFYRVCRRNRYRHKLFVSEYWAPNDFKCVLEMPVTSTLDNGSGNNARVERLYRV